MRTRPPAARTAVGPATAVTPVVLPALAVVLALAGCGTTEAGPATTSPARPAAVAGTSGTAGVSVPATSSAASAPVTPAAGTLPASPSAPPVSRTASPAATPRVAAAPRPAVMVASGVRAGNPTGRAAVPAAARAVDTRRATTVVGRGTPASCTSAAVVAAVAKGGVVRFACGPRPVTIRMTQTARVFNRNPTLVLDGGNLVTLSGGGARRILYMNTCDRALGWTTSHCQDQATPRLTLQNIAFVDGVATGQTVAGLAGGGGAVFVRGGRLTVVNTVWLRNRCDATGPDQGGAALRVFSQYRGLPVYVVSSTFGGAPGQGGTCSNGGALSSIGVSWEVLNSRFSANRAVGRGANPARAGTPGGGSGGAIYLDGNTFTLRLAGTVVEDNRANEGGGAVFFVSNDRTGTMRVEDSTLRRNVSAGFETKGFPGVFFRGARPPVVVRSTLR